MNDDDWDFFNKSVGKLEKEVITLKKENERLKKNIHSMLFTDDVVQDRYDKVREENTKLKETLNSIRNQCRYSIPRNGLNPVGDKAVLCKTFYDLINQVLGEE